MARVGGPSGDNHLRLGLERLLADDIHVDPVGLRIKAVGHHVVVLAREIDLHAVRQVPTVSQFEAHDGIAWLDQRVVHGRVCLRTRMGLNVRVIRSEEGLRPLNGQGFHLVHFFAAAVVPAPGVTFGVLVGEHGALSLQHRAGHDVL